MRHDGGRDEAAATGGRRSGREALSLETDDALVQAVQRMWVIAATAKIVREDGPDGVLIPYVAHRAGLAERTVLGLFGDRDRCLGATFEKGAALAAERTIPWFAIEVDPVRRVTVGAVQLLAFCDSEPELASVVLARAGPTATRRAKLIRTLSRIVADQLEDVAGSRGADAGEIGIRCAVDVVARRLSARDSPSMGSLLPSVLEMVLAPHLGVTAARIQASRPAPEPVSPRERCGPSGERPSLDLRLSSGLLTQIALRASDSRSQGDRGAH
ncbi:MAG: TetR/AcrR family transcriptional regulator [Solirubrobacteraceae bacterium]